MNDIIPILSFLYGIILGGWCMYSVLNSKIQYLETKVRVYTANMEWWHKHCKELEKELARKDEPKEDDADWWKKGIE